MDISKRITSKLLNRILEKDDINVVLLYHSLPDEVNTHSLIRDLHDNGKKVILPTVIGDDLELHEYVDDESFVLSSSFNIQESNGPLFTDYSSIDLAIIPGMAFTPDGVRLGRGKGYYDRLLPKISCPFWGLAFPFQIVNYIPAETHDVRMSDVLTV